ncbi:unnamed protein product [Closterium sp. NIES-64]|nr:unnamed protein product [Closterium sp. NIES-64]
MELNDVIGGNVATDGDHLAGPCDGDMEGDMDGDLLEGDDVLGASWDACDHTGNLEAILRSSYQTARHAQSGSATGQHHVQSSIAGILSHIHASAASPGTADAGKLLWEGPAGEFEAARRRGVCESERRGEGDGANAKCATVPATAVAEATEGGGTERARDTVEKLSVVEAPLGADIHSTTSATATTATRTTKITTPPRSNATPPRTNPTPARCTPTPPNSSGTPARSIRPSPFRRLPSSPAFSPAAPAVTSSPLPSHPCAFPPAPPTHRTVPYPSQPGLSFPPSPSPFPAPPLAPAPSAQRGLPPYPRLPFFPNYHQAYPAAALPLPPMPASFLAGAAGAAASASSAAAAGTSGAASSPAGEAAGAGAAGASAKVSTPSRVAASAAVNPPSNAPISAPISANTVASTGNAVRMAAVGPVPPHMPARTLMPFPGTTMPAPAFFPGGSMGAAGSAKGAQLADGWMSKQMWVRQAQQGTSSQQEQQLLGRQMYLFHRQQQLMRMQQQRQQQQQQQQDKQREKQNEVLKAEQQEKPLNMHRTGETNPQPVVRAKQEAGGDDTTRSGDSRPCTPAAAVAGATGDTAALSAPVATTARASSNPGESARPVQADASLAPSPPAAAPAATDFSENQIGRDCNEGKKRAREAQQEMVEVGGTDAVGQGRSKRLRTAEETVRTEPEGEAKAGDAFMAEAAVKAEQQDGCQAKEPSLQHAASSTDAAARESARRSAGGAGPAVNERAGSMECGEEGMEVESAALGQLYSTIAQLDVTTRDCIRSALLRLATSAQSRAMSQSAATGTTSVPASPAASVRECSATDGNASNTAAAAAAAADAARSTCVSTAPSAGEAADPASTNTPSRTAQTGQAALNPTATADAASPVTPVTASGKQQQQHKLQAQQQQQEKQEPGQQQQQQQVASQAHSNTHVPDSNAVDRVIAKLLFMAPPTPTSTHSFPATSPSSSHSTHPAASASQAPSHSHVPSHSHAASTLLVHSHSATSLTASFCSSATPTSIPQTSSTPHAHATSSLHPPPLAPPPTPPPAALPHPPYTSQSQSSRAAFPAAVPPSFLHLVQPSLTHPSFRQSPHAHHHPAMFPFTACFLPCCSPPDACSYTRHQNPSLPSSLHPYPTPPQHAHLAPISSAGPRNWMTWRGQSQPAGEMWVIPGQHSRGAGAMPAASPAGAVTTAGEARLSQGLQQRAVSGVGNDNRNHPCLTCY